MNKHDKPDATILMRQPNGKQSTIRVHKTDTGADIVFARSTQGEMLVMLPGYAAKELGEALLAAVGGSHDRD